MNLISKKDLLAITGISYGQLYRWKRERLIPEEWFIKQSSYTGQETFFPREQILSRIKSILDLKDDYSLEELAKRLSPDAFPSKISREDLKKIEEIDKTLLEQLPQVYPKEYYDFTEVALMTAISKAAVELRLSEAESGELFGKSVAAALAHRNINIICTIFTVGNEVHALFTQNTAKLEFDSGILIRNQIHLSEIVDNLKMKYKNLF
jgi:DNA-binding transcriptional MerR regulator